MLVFFMQENECVVRDTLAHCSKQFELEHILPHWTSRGLTIEDFPDG